MKPPIKLPTGTVNNITRLLILALPQNNTGWRRYPMGKPPHFQRAQTPSRSLAKTNSLEACCI